MLELKTEEERKVANILKKVIDPEMGLNIVDLGLVYEIKVKGREVEVTMTLTWPGCPLHDVFINNVEEALKEHDYKPVVKMTFDPPWTPHMITEEGKKALGLSDEEEEREAKE